MFFYKHYFHFTLSNIIPLKVHTHLLLLLSSATGLTKTHIITVLDVISNLTITWDKL